MTMYLDHGLLMLSAIWPMLNALLLAWRGSRPLMITLAPWAALPALMAAVMVPVTDTPTAIPGALLGSEIGLDATAKSFLLFTSVLWLAAGIYARTYIARAQQVRFYVYFLLTLAGNLRLIIAQDLLGFYFGYALMSFAAYGLVVFEGSAGAFRAGRVYIGLMVASELLLFTAFVLASHASGGTSFSGVQKSLANADNRHWIILLALTGFGVKTGLLGLHMWLPLAHSQAPTPASAVLSGAMVKVGVLGWLRLLPIGLVAMPDWGVVFLMLGLGAAFYGVIIGVTQRAPKTVLAYSSISQMGIMTAAVGMALLAPQIWPALLPVVVFYALQHSLNKGALFLGAGLVGKTHRLSHWWTWWVLVIPALALAGSPWTSGMLAKFLLKQQFHDLPAPWAETLPMVLTLASLATALLLARFLYLVRPEAQGSRRRPHGGILMPWLILVFLGQLLPWMLVPALPKLSMDKLFGSTWPILLTIAVVAVIARWRLLRKIPEVPAGDILLIVAPVLSKLMHHAHRTIEMAHQLRLKSSTTVTPIVQARMGALLAKCEITLNQWPVAITAALVLAVILAMQLG